MKHKDFRAYYWVGQSELEDVKERRFTLEADKERKRISINGFCTNSARLYLYFDIDPGHYLASEDRFVVGFGPPSSYPPYFASGYLANYDFPFSGRLVIELVFNEVDAQRAFLNIGVVY